MSDGDEYKPRKLKPFDPAVLDQKEEDGKDLLSVVGSLSDDRARNKLLKFINNLDVSRIKQGDFETVAKGFQGLLEFALYIGPMGERYRESIKIASGLLMGFARTHKDYLEIQYPEQLRKEFEEFKKEIIEAFEPYVEPEIFREIKSRFGL